MGISQIGVTSGFNPTTMSLRHTLTSSGTVSIPAGMTTVYAIVIGGGGAGGCP